jgi:hypothetical protein
MLSDCYISWLHMRALKLTLGKIIFLQIFLQFLFFSVKRPDSLLLSPDECSSDGLTVRWTFGHAWFCRMLMWQPAFGRVSDASRRLPYRFKYRFSSQPLHSPLLFLDFSWDFGVFYLLFLVFSHEFSAYFILLCILSHFQVFYFIFCIIFSFI